MYDSSYCMFSFVHEKDIHIPHKKLNSRYFFSLDLWLPFPMFNHSLSSFEKCWFMFETLQPAGHNFWIFCLLYLYFVDGQRSYAGKRVSFWASTIGGKIMSEYKFWPSCQLCTFTSGLQNPRDSNLLPCIHLFSSRTPVITSKLTLSYHMSLGDIFKGI